MLHFLQTTLRAVKDLTWLSLTNNNFRFAAATRLLGLQTKVNQMGSSVRSKYIHDINAFSLMLHPIPGGIGIGFRKGNPLVAFST